jgi:hypothetical protein
MAEGEAFCSPSCFSSCAGRITTYTHEVPLKRIRTVLLCRTRVREVHLHFLCYDSIVTFDKCQLCLRQFVIPPRLVLIVANFRYLEPGADAVARGRPFLLH